MQTVYCDIDTGLHHDPPWVQATHCRGKVDTFPEPTGSGVQS